MEYAVSRTFDSDTILSNWFIASGEAVKLMKHRSTNPHIRTRLSDNTALGWPAKLPIDAAGAALIPGYYVNAKLVENLPSFINSDDKKRFEMKIAFGNSTQTSNGTLFYFEPPTEAQHVLLLLTCSGSTDKKTSQRIFALRKSSVLAKTLKDQNGIETYEYIVFDKDEAWQGACDYVQKRIDELIRDGEKMVEAYRADAEANSRLTTRLIEELNEARQGTAKFCPNNHDNLDEFKLHLENGQFVQFVCTPQSLMGAYEYLKKVQCGCAKDIDVRKLFSMLNKLAIYDSDELMSKLRELELYT